MSKVILKNGDLNVDKLIYQSLGLEVPIYKTISDGKELIFINFYGLSKNLIMETIQYNMVFDAVFLSLHGDNSQRLQTLLGSFFLKNNNFSLCFDCKSIEDFLFARAIGVDYILANSEIYRSIRRTERLYKDNSFWLPDFEASDEIVYYGYQLIRDIPINTEILYKDLKMIKSMKPLFQFKQDFFESGKWLSRFSIAKGEILDHSKLVKIK